MYLAFLTAESTFEKKPWFWCGLNKIFQHLTQNKLVRGVCWTKIRTVSPILVEGPFPNASQEQLFHCFQHWMAVIHLASQKSWPRVDTGLLPAWHTQFSWKGRAKILPNTNNTHTLLNKPVGLVTNSTPGVRRRVLRFLSLLSFRSNCYFWGGSSVSPVPSTAVQCHMNKQ